MVVGKGHDRKNYVIDVVVYENDAIIRSRKGYRKW